MKKDIINSLGIAICVMGSVVCSGICGYIIGYKDCQKIDEKIFKADERLINAYQKTLRTQSNRLAELKEELYTLENQK